MASHELSGGVKYAEVLGSSMFSRGSFDGSIPYCISASGIYSLKQTSTTSETVDTVFSLTGTPGTSANAFGSAASLSGITKQCSIELHDIWFDLRGYGDVRIEIAVCDPSSFPAADKQLLYECTLNAIKSGSFADTMRVNVPDISSIVLVADAERPLNICVKISTTTDTIANVFTNVVFHSVACIDD